MGIMSKEREKDITNKEMRRCSVYRQFLFPDGIW